MTTRFPFSASIQPKLKVVVVLLTPPLWLNKAIVLNIVYFPEESWYGEASGSEANCFQFAA